MIGSGIVVLPYFMVQTGKPFGVLIFLIDTILATYSIYII